MTIDKYKYIGYGIGFDSGGTFSFPNGSIGENVIINFGGRYEQFYACK